MSDMDDAADAAAEDDEKPVLYAILWEDGTDVTDVTATALKQTPFDLNSWFDFLGLLIGHKSFALMEARKGNKVQQCKVLRMSDYDPKMDFKTLGSLIQATASE